MNKKRVFWILVIAGLIGLISATAVAANPITALSNFFSNGGYKTHAKIIDFLLFFTMFFSLAYLGFTKMWGEGFGQGGKGKGPIVALSFALGLCLAFALVSQTKWSITTMFPLAKAFLFLITTLLLYGLLIKDELLGSKTWGHKIAAFFIAVMLAYIFLAMLTHYVCQLEDNLDDPMCKSGPFTFIDGLIKKIGVWLGIGDGSSSGSDDKSTTGKGGKDSSGGGKGGGKDGTGGKGGTETGSDIQGGCRMDGTFVLGKTDYATGGSLANYIESVNQLKKNSIYVYGYASTEHSNPGSPEAEDFNKKLASKRAAKVETELRKIIADKGYEISVKSSGRGETIVFGDKAPNRRFVVATAPVDKDKAVPAPSPGVRTSDCPGAEADKKSDDKKNSDDPQDDEKTKSLQQEDLERLDRELDAVQKKMDQGIRDIDVDQVEEAVREAEMIMVEIEDLR